jgi:hypothetical protein
VNGEGLGLEADPLGENRFSAGRRIDHERRLLEAKREFIASRADIRMLQRDYINDDWWIRP